MKLAAEVAIGGAVYGLVVAALSFRRIREALAIVRKRRAAKAAPAG